MTPSNLDPEQIAADLVGASPYTGRPEHSKSHETFMEIKKRVDQALVTNNYPLAADLLSSLKERGLESLLVHDEWFRKLACGPFGEWLLKSNWRSKDSK